ncbi:MAG: hypothetical protein HC906_15390 [Bacteroidales bacterium]|nr:hypothetical protein [Bacteroidales bacterium]
MLTNGEVLNIKTNEFKVASTFLIGSTGDYGEIQFNQLNLIGSGKMNGVKGNFISQVSMFGAVEVKISECVKEVVF